MFPIHFLKKPNAKHPRAKHKGIKSPAFLNQFVASRVYTIWLLFAISGCQHLHSPANPDVAVKPAPKTSVNQAKIDRLLNEAEIALQRQRLTTPVEDNAYLKFLQVLAEDPANQDAEAGLQQIVETYLSWASAAIDREEFSRAKSMLNKASSVDESNPAIEQLRARLEQNRNQNRIQLKIEPSDLKNRAPTLISSLGRLAKQAESGGAIAKIRAQTDADARWIYQQMNAATQTRIRATIQSGVPPSVQLNFP